MFVLGRCLRTGHKVLLYVPCILKAKHKITKWYILVLLKGEEPRKTEWNLFCVRVKYSQSVYPDILIFYCVQMNILRAFSFFCGNETAIYYWSKILNTIHWCFIPCFLLSFPFILFFLSLFVRCISPYGIMLLLLLLLSSLNMLYTIMTDVYFIS